MTGWLENIIEALSNGVTVVTVNRRLSQRLRSAYKEFKLSSGTGAWETPSVMPVGAWVSKLDEEARSAGPVLTEGRSRALWMGIVERGCTAEERSVLFAQGVGETSYSAYKLMGEYCLTAPGLGPELYMSEEALAFKGWLCAYNRKLKATGFIDVTLLKGRVAESIKRGELKLPGSLLFAGFDEFTPAVQRLFDRLKESGVSVKDVGSDTSGETLPPIIKEYADEVEEVRAAAGWVREKLAVSGSVGVIVTDLNRYHSIIEREFSAELDPLSVLPWKSPVGVFNISLGSPLYDTPLVRSALSLLSIVTPEAEIGPVLPLLYSISAGDGSRGEIARFDEWLLKRKKRTDLSLKELKGFMEEGGKWALVEVASKVGKWIELLKKESSIEYPGCWAGRFASVLRLLGWPGAGGIDGGGLRSEEYQVVEAWRSILVEFSCFDDTLGLLTRSEAIAQLRRLAIETVHQVESPGSPVQVLGLFEAAGQHFEHLLLLGADSSTLPAPQNPNPFIPVEVQKRLNFKDSTPERTLAFARSVLERVLKSGTSVEVSYASTFGGVENLISPLLRGLSAIRTASGKESGDVVPGSSLKERLYASCVLEELPEEPDIPLSTEERESLSGGTGLIKEQSACPFRAFAKYRLGARGIEKVTSGFDPMDRGNTVHEALKLFWREVKDSKRLKEANRNGELTALVSKAVSMVMAKYAWRNLPAAYIELEGQRIEALVSEWLALELTREEFSVIGVECDEEIEVGGLKLQARLDRVDRLANGAKVIIDYKTGDCKKDYWLPGRPKEPQLLLYDLAGSFDAITFARLKIKDTKFVGVAKEGLKLPGIKPFEEDSWTQKIEGVESWDDLKVLWKETLESIAKEFASGVASVTPDPTFTQNSHPCAFCDFTTLCRRFELNVGPGRGF